MKALAKALFFVLFFVQSVLSEDAPFKKGTLSFEYQTGILFSPVIVHEELPSFNYWQTNLRIGRMLNSPHGKGIFRGNLEGIIEITASSVVEGKGSYLFGIGPLFRYNFVRKSRKFFPYIQVGAGVCYTDAYYYEATGQGFNFTIHLGIGVKYLLSKRIAIELETRYEHISNAGMDHRNKGINAIGPMFGFTYYLH